jgi:hypothetical protein
METIDQVATVASLCGTVIIAAIGLVWQLARRDRSLERVNQYFRFTVTASMLSGTVLLGLLVWLVGATDIRAVHHHYAYFIWFMAFLANVALGSALAFLGGFVLEKTMPANSTLEPTPKSGRGSM